MNNVWMVRAGEGGYLIDEFERGYVGIGWDKLGDLSSLNSQKDLTRFTRKPSRMRGQQR